MERVSPPGRTFIALVPSPEIGAAAADRLSSVAIPGRPVPPRNWHVTLRFVGPIDDPTYDRWLWSLSQVHCPPIRIRLKGMGAFPRARKATVFWLDMEGSGLDELAGAIEEATIAAGLPGEDRPFQAHLTLSRLRPPQDVRALIEATQPLDLVWKVDGFHVMAAVGSTYQIFDSFPLGGRVS